MTAQEQRQKSNNQIFSQEALDKLRSPEKLDTMLPITTPVSWMALISVLILLFSVVLWSIYGAFTVKADGMGLIMDSAGVMNVSHIANGKISHLYISPGMHIKKGDKIAHMEQAEQSADTRMAQYGMGLASNDRDAMGRAYQYDAKRYQQGIAEDIYSDYDGIVDEVMVNVGSMITAGTPICSVRMTQNREDLTGLLYIPVDKGKRVEPGMTIQLAPNGVDISQSGSLIGVVRSVSQYPVTIQGIQQHLGNAQLAQWILQAQNSSVMEVTFDLVKDENSESGYLWTSQVGKHRPITAGSFCTGSIIIERKPPIEKVFHKLSQWLRNR
ncbi:MAG: HlyD family efflux transporter periplasmic adaptor subunit [Selenomonadaceae bacterium]|nr:HlyD family efflux transporter periplasmic adaptor subunit [Selenomonadaceae bacterium]